jgi:hypothetical protein
VVKPESQQVVEGESLKLVCKVRGKPLPMVAWLNADQQIIDSDRSTTEVKAQDDKLEVESTFRVKKIGVSDESDQYRITAANSFGQVEHVFGLTVNQAPAFTHIPDSLELISGEDWVIETRATGRPFPTISWSKGKTDLQNATSEAVATETVSKFTFTAVTEEDEGTYTVKAKNIVGSVKKEVPVTGNYIIQYPSSLSILICYRSFFSVICMVLNFLMYSYSSDSTNIRGEAILRRSNCWGGCELGLQGPWQAHPSSHMVQR